MKICSKCKKQLDLSQFWIKNKKRKDGSIYVSRQCMCKTCSSQRRTAYYLRNKQTEVGKRAARVQENKTWFIEYKQTLKCSKCGDARHYVLDFHHKAEDKLHEVSVMYAKYSRTTLLREIAKCEVLCANCHRELHYLANNKLQGV